MSKIVKRTIKVQITKTIDVFAKDNVLVRTYDEDTHGKGYKKIAQRFVDKNNQRFNEQRKNEQYIIKEREAEKVVVDDKVK